MADTNQIFYSYDHFDQIRDSLSNDEESEQVISTSPLVREVEARREESTVLRVQVVDQENASGILEDAAAPRTTHRLLHIAGMYGVSVLGRSVVVSAYDQVKAALLAQHHFNNRIETVVPNLREMLRNDDGSECDLRVTIDVYDTQRSPRVAVYVLLESIYVRPFPYDAGAMVGAFRSATSNPLAILNTAREIPQVSFASTSTQLDEPGPFQFFGRVIPANDGDANVAVEYFTTVTKTTHLGILFVDDEYGVAYQVELERRANEAGITTVSKRVSSSPTILGEAAADFNRTVQVLADTGYNHFMGILFTSQFEYLLSIGVEMGIMGPGKFWLFGDGVSKAFVQRLSFPTGSPEAIALQGNGLLNIGASSADGSRERFFQALRKEEESEGFLQYWASKSPIGTPETQDPEIVRFPEDYVTTATGTVGDFSELSYDAVMSLAIAGCKSNQTFFNGTELWNEFLNSDFTGASGNVRINNVTGSRLYTSASYVVMNTLVRADENEEGRAVGDVVVVSEFVRREGSDGEPLGGWEVVGDNVFSYSDFSGRAPLSLPPRELKDVLELKFRAIFVALALVVMLSSISFAVWTWIYRKARVIRASQPTFLFVICLGEFLTALSVLFIGVVNPPQKTVWAELSCMPAIWCFSFGVCLVFSALFAKTWRLNKILENAQHFHRVTVTLQDVALPGTFLVLGGLLVTFIWQVTDPLEYKISFDEFGSLDQFGRPVEVVSTCSTQRDTEAYFASALWAIMGVPVALANYQAYKSRNFTMEYSESVYIGWSMAISLQALFLSIPVFFFDTDPQSFFIARSALLLVLASSTLYLMFIPKIYHQVEYVKREKSKAERIKRRKAALTATQEYAQNWLAQAKAARPNGSGTSSPPSRTQTGDCSVDQGDGDQTAVDNPADNHSEDSMEISGEKVELEDNDDSEYGSALILQKQLSMGIKSLHRPEHIVRVASQQRLFGFEGKADNSVVTPDDRTQLLKPGATVPESMETSET